MLIVALEAQRAELQVSNSRFIASLERVESAEAARAFIAKIKAEFADASHNVSAFVIGGGASSLEFCSDDGEPSGTSGRPLLAVLKGSGLGNCAIVVTRYFGGTLLGTGGLVRAYGEAGKAVLAKVRRAALVPMTRLRFSLPYSLLERERLLAAELQATIIEENFAEEIGIVLDIPDQQRSSFEAKLAELSAGRLAIEALGSRQGLLPLS